MRHNRLCTDASIESPFKSILGYWKRVGSVSFWSGNLSLCCWANMFIYNLYLFGLTLQSRASMSIGPKSSPGSGTQCTWCRAILHAVGYTDCISHIWHHTLTRLTVSLPNCSASCPAVSSDDFIKSVAEGPASVI